MDDKKETSTSVVAFDLEPITGDDTLFESNNIKTIDNRTNNDMNMINETNNNTILVSNSRFNITKLNEIDSNNINDDINLIKNSENSEQESDMCAKLDDIQQTAMTPDEALPDMDNYRNMQSFNGGIKSRPTLLELQVRSFFYF
jgi:hypothetical protein